MLLFSDEGIRPGTGIAIRSIKRFADALAWLALGSKCKGLTVFLDSETSAQFVARIRENAFNAALLDRLPLLGLPDCWLVAGCLFQTVWNTQTGRSPAENVRDYDVFYFDGSDLSYEAEDREIKRLADAFTDLNAKIELRNQARVHLWYTQRFGHAYAPLTTSTGGIDRFLVKCTCVGIRCSIEEPLQVYATYGLTELYDGILSPNPRNALHDRFFEKARSYQTRWPRLRIDPSLSD